MFTFRLTNQEIAEYRNKGFVARKGMTIFYPREDGTTGVRVNPGWTVYVRGKGYVRYYYDSKYGALVSAEHDAERTTLWGRDVTEEDIARTQPGSLGYDLYRSGYSHLQNVLKKESKK